LNDKVDLTTMIKGDDIKLLMTKSQRKIWSTKTKSMNINRNSKYI